MDIKLPGERDGIARRTEIFERFGIRSIFVSAYKDDEMLARASAAAAARLGAQAGLDRRRCAPCCRSPPGGMH